MAPPPPQLRVLLLLLVLALNVTTAASRGTLEAAARAVPAAAAAAPPPPDADDDDGDAVAARVAAAADLAPDALNAPLLLPRRAYAVERGACGGWVSRYARLHADVRAGRRPPRYAVFKAEKNGMADRLNAAVSVFLYALLTDRAFLFEWHGRHELWNALRSGHVDWRYDGAAREQRAAADAANGTLVLDQLDEVGGSDSARHNALRRWFWHEDLAQVGANSSFVVWTTNLGTTLRAFENRHLQPRLRALGLTPLTAYGCLFDFLFRPTPLALRPFAALLPPLLDQKALKVGIQVRTGDEALWGNQRWSLNRTLGFFECARQVTRARRLPGQRVWWLLLSDSAALRRDALEYFGPQLVLTVAGQPKGDKKAGSGSNSSSGGVVLEHSQDNADHGDTGLAHAAGEAWLFSLADAHVYTERSNFGRLGALLSGTWGATHYTIDITRLPERHAPLNLTFVPGRPRGGGGGGGDGDSAGEVAQGADAVGDAAGAAGGGSNADGGDAAGADAGDAPTAAAAADDDPQQQQQQQQQQALAAGSGAVGIALPAAPGCAHPSRSDGGPAFCWPERGGGEGAQAPPVVCVARPLHRVAAAFTGVR